MGRRQLLTDKMNLKNKNKTNEFGFVTFFGYAQQPHDKEGKR